MNRLNRVPGLENWVDVSVVVVEGGWGGLSEWTQPTSVVHRIGMQQIV